MSVRSPNPSKKLTSSHSVRSPKKAKTSVTMGNSYETFLKKSNQYVALKKLKKKLTN